MADATPTAARPARGPVIQDIPEELLLFILEFLGLVDVVCGASAVCRQWRRISHEARLSRPTDSTHDALRLLRRIDTVPGMLSGWSGAAQTLVSCAALVGVTLDLAELARPGRDGRPRRLVELAGPTAAGDQWWHADLGNATGKMLIKLALPCGKPDAAGAGSYMSPLMMHEHESALPMWPVRADDSFLSDANRCIQAADTAAAVGRNMFVGEICRCAEARPLAEADLLLDAGSALQRLSRLEAFAILRADMLVVAERSVYILWDEFKDNGDQYVAEAAAHDGKATRLVMRHYAVVSQVELLDALDAAMWLVVVKCARASADMDDEGLSDPAKQRALDVALRLRWTDWQRGGRANLNFMLGAYSDGLRRRAAWIVTHRYDVAVDSIDALGPEIALLLSLLGRAQAALDAILQRGLEYERGVQPFAPALLLPSEPSGPSAPLHWGWYSPENDGLQESPSPPASP
jgi:hypothetical protein